MEKEKLPHPDGGENGLESFEPRMQSLEERRQELKEKIVSSSYNTMNKLSENFLKSFEISSKTKIEMDKSKKAFGALNKHIDEEYKKQIRAIDIGGKIIDEALETGDLDRLREGIALVNKTANTNPFNTKNLGLEDDTSSDRLNDKNFRIEI